MIRQDPLVSICLTTYNHEKYIQEAVDTILKQHTDFVYELLISDDASTDRTQEILKNNYQGIDRVKLILHEKNTKGKNAYLAIRQARGKYIYYCEGDDYWIGDNGLQILVDWIEKHEEYIGVCGRRVTLSEKTGFMSVGYDKNTDNKDIYINDFLNNNASVDLCAMLYRNFYRDKKYNYKYYLASRNVGDLTTVLYILLHGKVFQLDTIVGVYRADRYKKAWSYNARTSPKRMFEDHMELISKIQKIIPEKLDFTRKRKLYADWYNSSILSTYDFIKQIPYLQKKIGIRMTMECLRDWMVKK